MWAAGLAGGSPARSGRGRALAAAGARAAVLRAASRDHARRRRRRDRVPRAAGRGLARAVPPTRRRGARVRRRLPDRRAARHGRLRAPPAAGGRRAARARPRARRGPGAGAARAAAAVLARVVAGRRDGPLVQTDGLGRAQVLEYDDGALWAATNKVAALRALGVGLELDPVDWAVKSAVGWFPMARSGYRHLTYLAPGTQLRVEPRGRARGASTTSLREWVHPPAMGAEDALEAGRAALVRHVRDGAPYFDAPAAGLSGRLGHARGRLGVRRRGRRRARRRSRAGRATSTSRSRGRLARIAGLELEVARGGRAPARRADDLERACASRCCGRAGHMWSENHKTFLSGDASALDGPASTSWASTARSRAATTSGGARRGRRPATGGLRGPARRVQALLATRRPGCGPRRVRTPSAVVREAFAEAAR